MDSILDSTKKILGIASDYDVFDLDIITHINSAFSVLCQMGVGPEDGFYIEDETAVWGDFNVPGNQLSLVRTYIFLKTRMLFDPPTTSYLIEAMNNQIREYEWRLNVYREIVLPPQPPDFLPLEYPPVEEGVP
jgi:hypothetical protein